MSGYICLDVDFLKFIGISVMLKNHTIYQAIKTRSEKEVPNWRCVTNERSMFF